MEVMGLMLGEFIDDYTVSVIDVFAMPQSGTGVSVEAVDPVFQTKMMDMLKQTGRCVLLIIALFFVFYLFIGPTDRPEMVVGWYHSHPGFGCWLSSVDVNTQQVYCFVFHLKIYKQLTQGGRVSNNSTRGLLQL
jgi:26S proteasome regulatory subunit N11